MVNAQRDYEQIQLAKFLYKYGCVFDIDKFTAEVCKDSYFSYKEWQDLGRYVKKGEKQFGKDGVVLGFHYRQTGSITEQQNEPLDLDLPSDWGDKS